LDGGKINAAGWLFQSNIQPTAGPGLRVWSRSNPPKAPLLARYLTKKLDIDSDGGYINNMKDKARQKNSMVHTRFTEPERRKIKAICALEGVQMQEYIRALVLQDLKRRKGKVRL